ncbi:MAG: acetate--CoA ligase family protein [Ignavibacteriales bacterium]|nr:acetate--CoA ligase family protein [Ignavibacteriales bacterium]
MKPLHAHQLNNFFYAKAICIPGASGKEKSIGYELLKTIKSYGFTGKILPVNPNTPEILGYQCYPSVEAITETIDLAIVVVPKKFVFDTITSLLAKSVKSIVLITAGFKETGSEGAENERKLLEMVQNANARLTGPNCMGVINSFSGYRLNATFVAEHPKESHAAFLSQSGALGAAVLNTLRDTDYSFGHFISVGNKADINENDLLSYWQQDDNITSIAMYLESFVNGERFIQTLLNNTNTPKPVIIVKAGRGEAGMKAASSHTGALGGSDRVAGNVLKQFGVIRAETVDEMFHTIQAFEHHPLPAGNRVAVMTNAGGPAILCVDALEKERLLLAQLSDETKTALREFVHPEGSVNNPVDFLPGGTAEQYKMAAGLLLADAGVDVVVSIFVEPVMVPAMPVIRGLQEVAAEKPLYQVAMPLPEFWTAYRAGATTAMPPVFRKPEEPSKVIANLLQFKNSLNTSIHTNRLTPEFKEALSGNQQNATESEPRWLGNKAIEDLCRGYGIPLVGTQLIPVDRVKNFAAQLSYPVVLKGIAEGLTHKSEARLVVVNIGDAQNLIDEARLMVERTANTGINLHSLLIQPFITQRFELLVGGFRDASFGPMLMFGTGGKYVEVWNDTAIRSAYANTSDINSMIEEVKIGKLLHGVRGEQPVDITKLQKILTSCAQMMLDHPGIVEFDLNPLIVTQSGDYVCVDARVKVR